MSSEATTPLSKPAPKAPIPGNGKLLKADTIGDLFRSEVQSGIAASSSKPKLVGILATGTSTSRAVGDAHPSEVYAQFTMKTCEALGVEYVLKRVEGVEDQGAVEEAIIEANVDDGVQGIMVYYPIFGGLQDHYLQQVVSPSKDVEGLNVKFHYNLYHNIRFISPQTLLSSQPTANAPSTTYKEDSLPAGIVKSILPCTPLAIVKSLEHMGVYNKLLDYGDRAYGRTITVINRSEVVGRPLAALLANDGARVFSVDIDSIQEYNKRIVVNDLATKPKYNTTHVVQASSLTLQECLALSDVVVSAVPSVSYKVPTAWLKQGCVCVNISSEKNFELNVRERASMYLPAVGKVTILMLLRNLLRLCEYQRILTQPAESS